MAAQRSKTSRPFLPLCIAAYETPQPNGDLFSLCEVSHRQFCQASLHPLAAFEGSLAGFSCRGWHGSPTLSLRPFMPCHLKAALKGTSPSANALTKSLYPFCGCPMPAQVTLRRKCTTSGGLIPWGPYSPNVHSSCKTIKIMLS